MPNSLFDSNQEWDLKTLIGNYNKGFKGSYFDPNHYHQFMSSLPMPLFGAAAGAIKDSGKGKLSLPYKSVLFFDPQSYTEKQVTGDCVSHGTRNAVDITRAVQMHIHHTAEGWVARGATEAIYGSRGHGGAGMACSQAAAFVHQKGGIVLRQKFASADLTKYTGMTGAGWGGRSGVPSDIIEIGKKHQIQTVSLVKTIEEVRDALANGYGVACCSGQGFSSVRDSKGYARAQGSWSHCATGNILISGPKSNRIKDVRVDDIVYGHDGKEHKVTHKFERQYKGKLVRFRAVGLPFIEFTDEHPIYIGREVKITRPMPRIKHRHGIAYVTIRKHTFTQIEYQWIKACDLQVGDYLVSPSIDFNQNNKIEVPQIDRGAKQTKNIPEQITEPDDDLAWLFGLYIADGNIVANHKVVITLGSKEIHSIERAIIAFRKLGMKTHVYDKGTFVRITVYSAVLARHFIKWFNGNSQTKRIPEFLFKGWNLKEVVEGVFDGDGCYTRQGQRIYTTSKELAYQIFHILISLGDSPRINYKAVHTSGYSENGSPQWSINWNKDRLKKGTMFDGMNYLSKIKEIEIVDYDDMVYNLEVSEVNSYIADGISVHNCMAIIGCDDTGSEPGFITCNSWGETWISGPIPEYGFPRGAFLAHADVIARMVGGGGTFAFSNAIGYPPQKLPDYGTKSFL